MIIGLFLGALQGAFLFLLNLYCELLDGLSICLTLPNIILLGGVLGLLVGGFAGFLFGTLEQRVGLGLRLRFRRGISRFARKAIPWIALVGFLAFFLFLVNSLVWLLLYWQSYQANFVLYMNAPLFAIEGIILALTPQMGNRFLRTLAVFAALFALLFSILTFGNGSQVFFFWATTSFGLSIAVYGLDAILRPEKPGTSGL